MIDLIFLGSKITADGDCSHEIKRHLLLGIKAITNLESLLKAETLHCRQRSDKSQSYGFSSSHVWMWQLDHKKAESQKLMLLNCGIGEDSESPLDCKEIQLVHPKGNQFWIFIWRTDVEAESPIFWPPDGKNWLTGKDPDAAKDWRPEKKGMTEVEMVGWHHLLYWQDFE